MKSKIVIVDDSGIIRNSVKQILTEEKDIAVLAEAGTGAELTEILAQYSPDIILLDINLPDANGIDLLKVIKKEYPGIYVILMSNYNEKQFMNKALEEKTDAYLRKTDLAADLVKAVNTVKTGEVYISEYYRKKFD